MAGSGAAGQCTEEEAFMPCDSRPCTGPEIPITLTPWYWHSSFLKAAHTVAWILYICNDDHKHL